MNFEFTSKITKINYCSESLMILVQIIVIHLRLVMKNHKEIIKMPNYLILSDLVYLDRISVFSSLKCLEISM